MNVIKPENAHLFSDTEKDFFDNMPKMTMEEALMKAVESSNEGWRTVRRLEAELRNAVATIRRMVWGIIWLVLFCFVAVTLSHVFS